MKRGLKEGERPKRKLDSLLTVPSVKVIKSILFILINLLKCRANLADIFSTV